MSDEMPIPARYRDWLLKEWDSVLDGWEQSLKHGRYSTMERSWYWRLDQHVRIMWYLDVMDREMAQAMVQARDPKFTGKRAMEDLSNADVNAFLFDDSHDDEDLEEDDDEE